MPKNKCIATCSDSRIKFCENRSKLVFLNPKRIVHYKKLVDGCLVTTGQRADWILTRPGIGRIIIELKGGNVEHGIKQLMSTLKYVKVSLAKLPTSAVIISSQCPRVSYKILKAKEAFTRECGGQLSILTRCREISFEDALRGLGQKR